MRSWLHRGLCWLSVLCLVASCGAVFAAEAAVPPRMHSAWIIPENRVAASGGAELYLNKDELLFAVYLPSTGAVFSNAVDTGVYTEEVYNAVGLRTFLSLTVAGKNAQDVMTVAGASGSGYTVSCQKVTNGFRAGVTLNARQIRLSVVVTLENGVLVADIPQDSIAENGEYTLMSVSLFPMLGAARGNQNGYVFIPDGSGSLIHLKDSRDTGSAYPLILPFYGEEDADEELVERRTEQGLQTLTCPVFGIKADDVALFANVTAGSAVASLSVAPGGYIYKNLYRSYVTFTCHRSYAYEDNNGVTQYTVNSQLIDTERTVRYQFLTGDRADYSGMAMAYQAYLKERFHHAASEKDAMPLYLDLFMGTGKEGFLFRPFVTATTFDQAQTVMTELCDDGVESLRLQLLGWNKGGWEAMPTATKPARQLGGNKGLNRLLDACAQRDVLVILQNNYLLGNVKSGSYNSRRDTVRAYPGTIVNTLDGLWQYLTGRSLAERYAARALTLHKRYPAASLSLGNVGQYLFDSFHRRDMIRRTDSQAQIEQALDTVAEQTDFSVSGGNIYAAVRSSSVIGLPQEHSGYMLEDEAVPFYEMVLHGWISYTTVAGNRAYDLDQQILNWVETGALPYFELTWESSEKLRDTEYGELFSSQYSEWHTQVVDIWRRLNTDLSFLQNQTLCAHCRLTDELVRTGYGDGTAVYINYGSVPADADGHSIPANSYLVVKGGAMP